MKILITGSLGFIGSNFLKKLIKKKLDIYSIDKHGYASNAYILKDLKKNKNFKHFKLNICNLNKIKKKILSIKPDIIINFAAETHVDNSIKSPENFVNSNIIGTFNLLKVSKILNKKKKIKFFQISTDEVYGDLPIKGKKKFLENSNLKPNSPYSASKASADMLVRAWNKTYNLPTIIVRSSNNYGPMQNKEKLIPKTILNLIQNLNIPLYGKGNQIRNWIYVEDNVEAILKVLKKGKNGEIYNIAGTNEISNIKLTNYIFYLLKKNGAIKSNKNFKNFVKFVKDRPGHDKRYSLDIKKIKKLGWKPKKNLKDGLITTINWYLKKNGI